MCDVEEDSQDTRAEHDKGRPIATDSQIIDSQRLFEGRQEIYICHNGETYRLRITRNGKLILNK
jgi:hemin uptake protein HemP